MGRHQIILTCPRIWMTRLSSREPALSSTVKPEIGNGIHHKGKDILNYQDTVKSDLVAVTRKTEGAISSNTRPLRRPEKATTKSMNAIKFEDKESVPISTKSKIRLTQKSKKESGVDEGAIGHKAWLEWEKKVVVKGSLDDDDLQEIAVVEDNDDISDVIVHQYIDALHKNQKKKGLKHNNKITPNQVQQLSKLKSTSNADCVRVAPGTLPNPPKGDDRWGGVELKSVSAPSGWGNLESDGLNRYNDGSACWSSQSNPYGGVSWSNCS
ncbi:predicted protein [Nematostella vectensis]|uniref:Uncharacterized protein n=1 Tax=Nematostella vectensis TaxID=45351 RepID=A7RP42_NEMVE|nr:predicted protein [Nematostella vectensis]|eukprot:XP_001638853.1 predicted protein [Nematostella vectensis]